VSEHIKEVNEENFQQVVLQSEVPVLVDFWAEWCAPCRALAPVVAAFAEKHARNARVVKLNVDHSPALTQRYGIRGIPTLILFKGGEERERLIGVASEPQITRAIEKYLNSISN
jgi:thioredoxin 1